MDSLWKRALKTQRALHTVRSQTQGAISEKLVIYVLQTTYNCRICFRITDLSSVSAVASDVVSFIASAYFFNGLIVIAFASGLCTDWI